MRLDCEACIQILEDCPSREWAETFVKLQMRFWREHCMGLVFSTIHGADFFENILKCLDGTPWELENNGEYEENFRKFIHYYRKKNERRIR